MKLTLTVFEESSCEPCIAIKVCRNHKLSNSVTIAHRDWVLYDPNTSLVCAGGSVSLE